MRSWYVWMVLPLSQPGIEHAMEVAATLQDYTEGTGVLVGSSGRQTSGSERVCASQGLHWRLQTAAKHWWLLSVLQL